MTKPIFITFEGQEGSGKTTQSKRLVEYIKSQGKDAIWTREIGGTDLAEKIRDLVVFNDMDTKTELLLAVAARVEHYKHVIKPALESGKIVVCDRFIDSSLAYQGQELGIDYVYDVHNHIFGDLMPDITFYIDVPIEVGLERAKNRGNNNRFESMPIEVHEKIRDSFHNVLDRFSDRIIMINGDRNQEEVFDNIISELKI